MFTGIITDIGTIVAADARGDRRVTVQCRYDMAGVAIGASIACSGACMTVVEKGEDWFAFDVSGESISKTAGGMWNVGGRLNLERAMKIGDELGGHIVTGHVDGVGEVRAVTPEGDSLRIDIAAPESLAAFVAAKGSVTIDGVSLTVNAITDDADGAVIFTVNIIPHTAAVTTLGSLTSGSAVNLEIDILARYLARLQQRSNIVL